MNNLVKITFLLLLFSCPHLSCFANIDVSKIKATVHEWSDAHNNKDIARFDKLFAGELIFYGKNLNKEKCIKKKFNYLNASRSFNQIIASDILITNYSSGIIKCNFTKAVTYNGKTKNYPAYLLFNKVGSKYLIVGESDLITDFNLKYQLDIGRKVDDHATNDISLTSGNNITAWVIVGLLVITLGGLVYWNKSKSKISISPPVKIASPLSNEIINKNKGDDFEKYVVKKFNQHYFKLINWRSDKAIDGIYPESNKYPDLEFLFNYNTYSKKLAIECKYRRVPKNGFVDVSYPEQLIRYKRFQHDQNMHVYVVLGMGGSALSPHHLFLIPLDKIDSPEIHVSKLHEFHKNPEKDFYYNIEYQKLT